jgi:hypothetical protein
MYVCNSVYGFMNLYVHIWMPEVVTECPLLQFIVILEDKNLSLTWDWTSGSKNQWVLKCVTSHWAHHRPSFSQVHPGRIRKVVWKTMLGMDHGAEHLGKKKLWHLVESMVWPGHFNCGFRQVSGCSSLPCLPETFDSTLSDFGKKASFPPPFPCQPLPSACPDPNHTQPRLALWTPMVMVTSATTPHAIPESSVASQELSTFSPCCTLTKPSICDTYAP